MAEEADGNFGYNSVYRSQPLDDRIKAVIGSGQKFTRGKLVEAMEDAATVDLRADQVLPYLIRVRKSAPVTDPAVADAITKLEAWRAAGGHRKTPSSRIKTYDHSDAIRIFDAWWPLLAATKVPAATTSPATADCTAGDQFCADQIVHQPMGE